MITGWRKAFCTSISKDTDSKALRKKHQQHCDNDDTNQTPRASSNFAFFSNPSTPRLRCRTSVPKAAPTSSVPNSPRLRCRTAKTPKKLSDPPSPKSPSSFSLLKASLRLSKSKCGICMQNVKAGSGTAIFTAECSHTFHFHCVATHVTKQQILLCPVCSTSWKELPSFSMHNDNNYQKSSEENRAHKVTRNVRTTKALKVYSDDEPLMSPTSVARFNPIPESDENDEVSEEESIEFQGFNVNPVRNPLFSPETRDIEMSLLPEAAIMAANRNYETYVMVLKVKAPPCRTLACRAPIDLVMVLDVGGTMASSKLQVIKRSMRLVISSLGSTDRLSIVAFSLGSKRLLPLRRMTSSAQRSARRIVDKLTAIAESRAGSCFKDDALRKAAKVLEDRREQNPVASIVLLSDGENECITNPLFVEERPCVSSTRHPHLDIPVHSVRLPDGGTTFDHAQPHYSLGKYLNGLLNMVAQDLRLQLRVVSRPLPAEIAAVYCVSGGPTAIGAGLVRLGDLYADEERALLVELKVPAASAGSHHVLSVRSSYRDPPTRGLIYPREQALPIPRPHAVRSSDPKIERLRNLHVTARAIAESRRLAEHRDLCGAGYLLSSARALLTQSASKSAEEYLRWLEAELFELQRRRQKLQSGSQRNNRAEKMELLTPTSAWRAAERLAKVAIMRKSLNRVSDLHGFENARF
ncbi:E3 ubiquitin-protein ligase WAVH1-like [Neltuma alba]|uniref:E3 ubiquitin-protein ligase WAVH1-like n=1 Tax=Neltuma alba TaxID=207710 RepID=UPI0010A43265|nr:E3 ubiquitin-protein ligase WAVH1-like [Prosopis alba]